MSHTIAINDKLYNEIKEYCDLNKIKPSVLCNDLLKKSLIELKYGNIPFGVIEHLKGNKTVVEYNEPTESAQLECNESMESVQNNTKNKQNFEPIVIENIPVRPIGNEIIPVIPMSPSQNFQNGIPVEIMEQEKKQKEIRKKRTRELK